MSTGRAEIGRRGEDIACRYLIEKGHTILERNWRSGHLEVDIISLDREGLHFVEVKSRVAPFSAAPEESVGYVKQKRIIAAAERYIHSRKRIATVFELPDIHMHHLPEWSIAPRDGLFKRDWVCRRAVRWIAVDYWGKLWYFLCKQRTFFVRIPQRIPR